MKPEKVAAIILAAGYSSRMGKFKQLLPLGAMTVLERSIHLFQSVAIADIRVVVGYRSADVLSFVEQWGAHGIINEQYWKDMFSSVVVGVNSLKPDTRAFFLLPVDVPLIRPQTILDLLEAQQLNKEKNIFCPVFMGKRGHPPLIVACYAEAVKRWTGQGGLRNFLEQHEHQTQEVEVADEGVVFDLDTPSDYEMILSRYQRYDIPNVNECMLLLMKKFAVHATVLDHCREVARILLQIGKALIRMGYWVDLHLIAASGLLHDLAKGKPNHASVGAEVLTKLGYHGVAEVVRVHHDIVVQDDAPLSISDILYLADKVVKEDRIVSLEERFREKIDRYGTDPGARAAICGRLAQALIIKGRLENILGTSLETVLAEAPPGLAEAEKDDLFASTWGG